ncbi:hypothetical protein DSCA_45100 [Desulfosarcina alkanivorans]|uniref:Uncharacterized protein n=1 Tax=Desulfosarcina alkanivorans TaxID=571177 RepID=A0A5K7YQD9_9BACT|nr:hypothetical protein DSCA_45100 [Desulfosarcina alkanivorans]
MPVESPPVGIRWPKVKTVTGSPPEPVFEAVPAHPILVSGQVRVPISNDRNTAAQ